MCKYVHQITEYKLTFLFEMKYCRPTSVFLENDFYILQAWKKDNFTTRKCLEDFILSEEYCTLVLNFLNITH